MVRIALVAALVASATLARAENPPVAESAPTAKSLQPDSKPEAKTDGQNETKPQGKAESKRKRKARSTKKGLSKASQAKPDAPKAEEPKAL